MDKQDYQIIIAGAGPTGLALGAELKRLGVSSLILDRLEAGANTSRAIAIQARTLEVLEPLGVTSELLREGIKVTLFRVRDRNRVLTTISFKDLETKYPYVLMCPQYHTEAILLNRLQSLGGEVNRPCEVVAIDPREDDVQVQFKRGKGLETVYIKWLVDCEGMHSVVREQAHIPFAGGDYTENFVLADVEMDWSLDRQEVSLFFSEKGLVVVAPLPGNQFRIVAIVKDVPSDLSIEYFQHILEDRGPLNADFKIHHMAWASPFHLHYRMANTLRQGRIILAGDAAHVHSPAGGQGMNTGIQDAISLAEALHQTLEQNNDSALDLWQKKRLEIARSVVKLTDQLTKVATVSSQGAKVLHNTVISIIGHIPYARHALAEKLSELDNR